MFAKWPGAAGAGFTKSYLFHHGKSASREHLCLIYDTQEEQFAAALPYLRTCLEQFPELKMSESMLW